MTIVCDCMCVFLSKCACLCKCVCVCAFVCVCVSVCGCVSAFLCLCVCVCVCVCVCTYISRQGVSPTLNIYDSSSQNSPGGNSLAVVVLIIRLPSELTQGQWAQASPG